MHEDAIALATGKIEVSTDLAAEFDARLAESSTLAFRVAFSVLRHREDAEDVAQEAYAKAHRKFRQLRDPDRFRAWIVRMTWRLALDRRRNDRRRLARERAHAVEDRAEPEDGLVTRERAAQLWAAIDALPDKLRIVIVLSGIEEHRIDEVAKILELPAGTVKSRLFLARRQLKERLACTMMP
jgi:RNA polymerase sigma-70 factor, ECF subfamily